MPSFQKWQKVNTFSYTSPDIQNELINIIANLIRKSIVETITLKGLFWSLIADETTDGTRIEQFTFVVRFADSCLNVFERFLGFWATPDVKSETLLKVTGKLLVLVIKNELYELVIRAVYSGINS